MAQEEAHQQHDVEVQQYGNTAARHRDRSGSGAVGRAWHKEALQVSAAKEHTTRRLSGA